MKKLTLLTCLLISVNIFAQPFSLIKEINTTANSGSLGAAVMQRVGTTVYFVSNDGISGNELWKSDGTAVGTTMVKDINPGSASTTFANFTAGDGLLFFAANDGVHGFELWRTDGTSNGTFMLRDGFSECTFCLNRFFFHNGLLYFAGDDGTTGAELWKSDGTVAGTVLVKDIYPGPTMSHPAPTSGVNSTFVALGNDVYFTAVDAVAGRELFKTDGTEAGTVMIKDIYPGAGNSISTVSHKAAVSNGKVYFAANDGPTGTELWATDGTEAGTYLVKELVRVDGRSQPNNLTAFNGALYFTASSSDNALPELWKTDGTEAGTVMVRNLVADGITLTIGNSALVDQFTVANGKLFFRGTGPTGIELYATDGTTAGTGIVKDIYPGINNTSPNGLFAFNNNLYFQAIDADMPSRGGALYRSDGTAAGTVKIMDAESGGSLAMPAITMTSAGGRLFFWGNTIEYGTELWSTDGTNANTSLVKDIANAKIGTPNSGVALFGSIVHNGFYYYSAADETHGNEIWKSDGTTAGTVMVKDIWPGKAPSNPSQFFVYNGEIYFTASDGVSGTELWKTDGTEAGTVLVADINPGSVNSTPFRFCISNNLLYFTAYHSLYGAELWRSDGTQAGTNMVLDLITGPASGTGGFIDVVSLNNSAYAIMNIAAGNVLGIPLGNRLIKIDGVSNTISDFAPVVTTGIDLGIIGTTLFVTGRNSSNQTLLWKSENGGALTQVKILSTTSTNAYQLTNCGNKLYFSASNGTAAGMEPWVSDGTDAGTFMLKDINPGTNPSTPYQFIFSGGKVFFTSSSTGTTNGEYELWATDGTTGGTYLVKDILTGLTGSRPNATISAFGNKVLFTANDGTTGYEVWQSDGTTAGTFLLQEFNTNGDGVPLTGVALNFPTDYVYSKLGDKIVFFARSADKGLQLYSGSIASPYKYVNDNSRDNDVFTTAVGSNTNNGSQSAPYATLSYAVSQAVEGDTIYVDAGLYFEQVTLDKGITLVGAGSGVTIVFKPAVTNPPPGPFQEPGTIQTAQNIGDVHIRDMSVTGDNAGVTPIILQTGGSVKNCRLIGGNQGIYFRVNPAVKTAVIENNYINVEYIGINCQGSGLSASLINNTIELNNPFFAAGVFAGLDFGPLLRFTAFGNIIRNYNAQGMLANSFNTNITQNSFSGTGAHAIEQSTNSLGFATCNWYGTTDAGVIASKVSGFFSYTPFLTNGTNTNTIYGLYGFVPVAGSCSEGVSNFYVNDNSQANDVFTTAVGSNSNAGTRSAPFATLSYAISVAPANSVIHVDAGTYAEQVIIDRGIVINGAGKDLTNFIKPATTLVPAPGPFTEIGLIETTQGIGDVHIRNISVNSVDGSSQNIIIQAGGSVKNCKLLNGGQGVFFRIASGSRNAEVSFNTIQPTGIGINCQGAGLTAIIVNNTISNPAGYYAAIFAGLDFGFLPQITITNNKISDYFDLGILANANSSNVTNNSIVGPPARIAIQGNALNATCNWYGTNTPSITGPVIYSPFLTSGTDNNSIELGFQPVPGACTGVQHKFYVNDNDNTGDVFTTAVGNDANSGSPAAPLRTLEAAYFKAVTGDTIFVDAGSFIFNASYTLTKGITFLGANYTISPNDPSDKEKINPARNKETELIALSFSAGVENISFEGFTFDPGNRAAFTNTNPTSGNFRLLKNRFKINSALNQIHFIGSGTPGSTPAQIVGSGITISDNRFEKYGVATGTNIVLQLFKNVTISENSFVTNGAATSFEHAAFSIGFDNRPVDEVYITNNLFDSLGIVMNGSMFGHLVISGNRMHDTRHMYNYSNFYQHNSEFEFSNNQIETTLGVPVITYNRQSGNLGSSSAYNVENNTINIAGSYNLPVLSSSLFNTFVNASVINPSVVFRGNKISYTGSFSLVARDLLRPMIFRWALRNVLIEKNEIVFSGTDLRPISSNALPGLPAISIYTDNGVGQTIPSGSSINILNNKIHGFTQSVMFYDPNGGAGSSANPFVGYGNLSAGVDVNISNNSFTGDSISINNGAVSQSVLATCNWYGSTAAQDIINKVTISTVEAAPWLTNGTDNEPLTTGFQPVGGSCDGYPPLIVLDNYTDVTCNGANNGSINITTTYGKAPFTYTWTKDGDPGFISHAEDPTNLSPGTYHLTVVDGNGSTIYVTDPEADGPGTIEKTITEPSLLTASASGTNVNCFNGTNGTASVLAGGGTAPYSYLWSNGATTSSITDLAAGIYNVIVTDDNGCTEQASYEVTQPALLTVSIANLSTGCSNGAEAIVNGGTAPYNYVWSNGSTSPVISSVPPGTYNVLITDDKGCTTSANITLAVGEAFNPSASVTNVNCFGSSTGIITVTNANGTAPFTFSIDGINFVPGSLPYSFTGLTAGTYTIAVRDLNGCTGFAARTIIQPAQLTAILGAVQSTCFGQNTGAITVTVAGGSGSVGYSWIGPNGFTNSQKNISGLAVGNYTLTVTDNNGCTAVLNAVVPSFNEITVNAVVGNVICKGETNGSINLTVTGGSGSGFSYVWNNGATTEDRVNIGTGNYSVTITDIGSGCTVNRSYSIGQAANLLKLNNPVLTNVMGCTPALLGTISATAQGGITPYEFKVGAGNYQSSGLFSGLTAGTYTVYVRDAYGCVKSLAVTVTDDGYDIYDGTGSNKNNSKDKAAPISLGTTSARIAVIGDPRDWYRFTTNIAGNYTLSLSHPSASFTINLYTADTTAAKTPLAGSTALNKTYYLLANKEYFIQVTGGLSFECYLLSINNSLLTRISTGLITQENKTPVDKLSTSVFPNPHRGAFGIKIESAQDGAAVVEVLNASGQLVAEKRMTVNKGGITIVNFTNMNHNILFYRVRIGNETRTGKIIGPN